jgi:cell division protease FtsH
MASSQETSQQGQPPQQPWRTILPWWPILLGLLAWNVLSFWPGARPEVTIPYTTFLAQVRADNVASVHLVGEKITGAFVKPFLWPQPKPSEVQPAISAPSSGSPEARPEQLASPAPATYTAFRVTFPEVIGDPNLLPLLETHEVMVDVAPPPSHWLTYLLSEGLPLLLLVGFFLLMSRQAGQSQAGLFSLGRTKARRYTSDRPELTFADVAGADEAKAALQEEVDFLRHPQKYHDLGARIPRGVLLVGLPGTGKTLLGRAVAGEAAVPFFSISGSEFVEMFVGVGASRVRDLFAQATAAAPAIVFIDELDAVGRRRGAGLGPTNDEREQTLNQLLVEMDGFDEWHEVIVLAATNRPDVLDPALLRPGRFDRQVMVGLPDRPGREGILRIHTRPLRLGPDVDLPLLARTTVGFSGADLANLCNEAALIAARHAHHQVAMPDFEEALDKVRLGEVRPRLQDPDERRVVAYHEAGHALVAWLTPAADPVYKVTIIPHGRALGVTEQLPGEDRHNYSRTYLVARLAVMLGGRTTEEIVLGEVTTGAESDLVEATRLARRMVTRWGMGDLGLVAFKADEEHLFLGYELAQGRDYSEATAARIDQEVQRLLTERHEAVRELLMRAREQLDRLVETLLQEEIVDRDALVRLLGPRPEPQLIAEVSHAGANNDGACAGDPHGGLSMPLDRHSGCPGSNPRLKSDLCGALVVDVVSGGRADKARAAGYKFSGGIYTCFRGDPNA